MTKAIKISNNVYWVGAIDKNIRDFHGYNTDKGTTYNAFLILGDKPILIDTVKEPFCPEMMARISSVIEPQKIAYIISNHAEMDHSGCLPQTIAAIQPEQVFASNMGVRALKAHFHFDIAIDAVDCQQTLTLGNSQFKFIETRMLHWPDSMFTYFVNDGVLFSQDGFGMHLAIQPQQLFADQNERKIMRYEAAKYFANIILPYSALVTKLLVAFSDLHLDVKLLAPDHGPLWRTAADIDWIMELWRVWALQQRMQKAVIVYATMWDSTAKMAAAIAEGLHAEKVTAKLMPLATSHRSDVITELLEAGALIVGSPTINKQMFPTVADILCYLRGLKRQHLIGQAFGSYGWNGEAIEQIQTELQNMGVELVAEPVKVQYVPDDHCLQLCDDLGKEVARRLKNGK